MSPALQVKLLRVLQEGTFTPVGGTAQRQVDVRLIAATHKDLGEMVKKGEFREDLYYRINVIRIQVPPLRDRKDDLPVLIDHFMRKHKKDGQRARALAPDALAIMQQYHWPGNIRELENEIERLLVLGNEFEILPADLLSSRIKDAVSGASGTNVIGASRIAQLPAGKLNDAVETARARDAQPGPDPHPGQQEPAGARAGHQPVQPHPEDPEVPARAAGHARRGRGRSGAVRVSSTYFHQGLFQTEDGAPLWFESRGEPGGDAGGAQRRPGL